MKNTKNVQASNSRRVIFFLFFLMMRGMLKAQPKPVGTVERLALELFRLQSLCSLMAYRPAATCIGGRGMKNAPGWGRAVVDVAANQPSQDEMNAKVQLNLCC